ncbi:hypothetical protein [Niabella aquatica]
MRPGKYMFSLLLLFPFALMAQDKIFFNWKGNALEVFEKPDVKSKLLGKIAKGASVEVTGTVAGIFPVYLSYYGDTVTAKKEEHDFNERAYYTMKSAWVKVKCNNTTGFVPDAYLSRLEQKKLPVTEEYNEGVNRVLECLEIYFGKPGAYKKDELEKQDSMEVHTSETYHFAGKVHYIWVQQYFEDSGAGGETHTIFLPGFKLNEAVLFLLQVTGAETFRPGNVKSFNKLKSSYDNFSWWYQPVSYNDDGVLIKAPDGQYRFYYETEGSGSSAAFTEKDGGIEIVYGYGEC